MEQVRSLGDFAILFFQGQFGPKILTNAVTGGYSDFLVVSALLVVNDSQ